MSGGIEPVFSHYYDRTIQTFDGELVERVSDYAYARGVEGRKAGDLSVDEHLDVLALAQDYVDSACSKTINVGDDVSYEAFKDIYLKAWKSGVKGCTTFRASGLRFGILNETVEEEAEGSSPSAEAPEEAGSEQGQEVDHEKVEACFIDP